MEHKIKQVGKYTVYEYGTLQIVRTRMFVERAEPLKKKASEGEALSVDDEAYNLWLDEWVRVASIVQPYMSPDEYEKLSLDDYVAIMTASDEVNSELAEFARKTVSKKKKPKTPTKSTPA